MNVVMANRASVRRDFIESCVRFFINQLKLERSTYTLAVRSVAGLGRAQDARGGVVQEGNKQILMFLDSNLRTEELVQTIAHEMIHVKQIARGRLTCFIEHGELVNRWLGETRDLAYHMRPWEIEAFRKEKELAYSLWSIIK
jgi:hypothetical protein